MMIVCSEKFHANIDLLNKLNLENSIKTDDLTVMERIEQCGINLRNKNLFLDFDIISKDLNLSTDIEYRNISNDLNFMQEFWTVAKRTLFNDLRNPVVVFSKIFQ